MWHVFHEKAASMRHRNISEREACATVHRAGGSGDVARSNWLYIENVVTCVLGGGSAGADERTPETLLSGLRFPTSADFSRQVKWSSGISKNAAVLYTQSEANLSCFAAFFLNKFLPAVALYLSEVRFRAVQDGLNHLLAGDVLYLAAAETVRLGKLARLLLREVGNHVPPDFGLGTYLGLIELYLVEEPSLEGLVKVLGEVRSCDKDAVKVLHLLEDDVLDGVLHLVDSPLGSLLTDT